MIPKVIHYCWFSKDKKPARIQECIDSWSRVMPDYEIKCWGADSFDFNSVPFVKEAYRQKRWAYVSDYVRLYAVYTEGGIYLDSDVMVFNPFDPLLKDNMFTGLEYPGLLPQAAIFGAKKGNPILKELMSYYEELSESLSDDVLIRICKFDGNSRKIFNEQGETQLVIAPVAFQYYFEKYGFKKENIKQKLGCVTIYPVPIFVDQDILIDESTYAWHKTSASWINPLFIDNKNIKGKLYLFCKKYRLYKFYMFMQSIKKRLYGES